MRILMLCDGMGTGGAETHILTLCECLVRRGNEVTLLSGGGSLVPSLLSCGARHITLPLASHSPLDMHRCRRYISRLIRKERFDLLHSHSRLASTLVSDLAKRRGLPLVTTVHARFSLTPLRRRFSRWGDLSVAVSQDLKQYLIDNYDASPENVTVIHNGVDGSRFSPRLREGALTVGFLSRLDGDSSLGARLLCEIAPRLYERSRGFRIIIGGGGEELKKVRELAREANEIIGEECIACVGEVADTSAFLGACDIFVGVSRAAIEASLCSSAVVLCGNEGFGGVLDGENFLSARLSNFCARGDGAADGEKLLAALSELIDEGREALRARGEILRDLSLCYCSAERAAEDTEKVYRRACCYSGKRGGSLLCGYYGFGNMGDDILLRAAAKRARAEFSDGRVRALTNGGKRDARRFGIACTCRHFPISVIFEIARCRRLIFGGGTLLQSETSRRSFVYYASLLIIARLFHKDCILWGNGIGGVKGNFEKRLLALALGGCRYIGLRDMRSLAIARHILKDSAKESAVALEADLAESAESLYSSGERAVHLLRGLFGDRSGEIVAAMPRRKSREEDILHLSKMLASEKRRGAKILFIVMNSREDRRICEELARSLGGKTLCGICFGDAVEVLKKCKRAYSMRLHGLVAAHLAGVEFFGFGEDEKIKRYCAERGGVYLSAEEKE